MPPRFKFAKNTLMTAYAIRMMQNSTMSGLVTELEVADVRRGKIRKVFKRQFINDVSGDCSEARPPRR